MPRLVEALSWCKPLSALLIARHPDVPSTAAAGYIPEILGSLRKLVQMVLGGNKLRGKSQKTRDPLELAVSRVYGAPHIGIGFRTGGKACYGRRADGGTVLSAR